MKPDIEEALRTGPPSPNLDSAIWRYMGLRPAFWDLITERRLLFRQFKNLIALDDCEGRIIPGFSESLLNFFRDQNPQLTMAELEKHTEHSREQLEILRCLRYASCWIMVGEENTRMWQKYAPHGAAIKTTVRKLKSAEIELAHGDHLRAEQVVYADSWEELAGYYKHNGIVLNRLFLHAKRRKYSYEHEVRFSVEPYGFTWKPSIGWVAPDPLQCHPHFFVTFRDLSWIDEVILTRSASLAESEVRKLTDQQGITLRISRLC